MLYLCLYSTRKARRWLLKHVYCLIYVPETVMKRTQGGRPYLTWYTTDGPLFDAIITAMDYLAW